MGRGLWSESFCLRTDRDAVAVMACLRRHTLTGEWDDGHKPEPCWRGTLPFSGTSFRIAVCGLGRNSWRPIWRCTLTGGPEGSRLEVRAGCHWLTMVLTGLWFGLLAWETLRLTVSGAGWVWAATLPFWAAGLGLGALCFWIPERRAKERLCRILNGTLEQKGA